MRGLGFRVPKPYTLNPPNDFRFKLYTSGLGGEHLWAATARFRACKKHVLRATEWDLDGQKGVKPTDKRISHYAVLPEHKVWFSSDSVSN